MGLYYQNIRENYPGFSYEPRRDVPVEQLGSSRDIGQQVGIPLGITFPQIVGAQAGSRRVWLTSVDESRLIQIQDDWFVHNWRHRTGRYVHFEAVFDEFETRYAELREVLINSNLEHPQPLEVEVTYTNWITELDISEFLRAGAAGRLSLQGVGNPPEAQSWSANYLISRKGATVARLRVSCSLATKQQDRQIQQGNAFMLSFKAPTAPNVTLADLVSLVALGRVTIVNSFHRLTTDYAHGRWGYIPPLGRAEPAPQ